MSLQQSIINIKNNEHKFTYGVRYNDIQSNIENTVFTYRVFDNKVLFYHEGYNNILEDVNDYYEILEPGIDNYLPNNINLSDVFIYIPSYSVDYYNHEYRYVVEISTYINKYKVILGSYLLDKNELLAVSKPVRMLDKVYYTFKAYDIIDPWYINYGQDWEDFRINVCNSTLYGQTELNNDTSLLNVEITPVIKSDLHWIKGIYTSGICSFMTGQTNNRMNLVTSTSMDPMQGLRFNTVLNFNEAYSHDFPGLEEYIRSTYTFSNEYDIHTYISYILADSDGNFSDPCMIGDDIISGSLTKHDTDEYEYLEDPAGTWRTFTSAEMNYIIHQRTNASNLRAFGIIDNTYKGILIFPDDYEPIEGINITPNCAANRTYTENSISLEQFELLEAAGVVFLPASYALNPRYNLGGSYVTKCRNAHIYWTGTINNTGQHWGSSFTWHDDTGDIISSSDLLVCNDNWEICNSFAIRLIKEVDESEPHSFYTGHAYIKFAPGNLQYNYPSNKFRFASTQYEVYDEFQNGVTEYSTNFLNGITTTTLTDDRWIDLFGYGTSGYGNVVPSIRSTNKWLFPNANISGTNYDWGSYNIINHIISVTHFDGYDQWINSWEDWKEDLRLISMCNIYLVSDGIEADAPLLTFIASDIPITREVFKYMISENNYINIDTMNINVLNTVNKIEKKVINVERPDDYNSPIYMPIYIQSTFSDDIAIHNNVNESIAINLSAYTNNVKVFTLMIGDVAFKEVIRKGGNVVFKITGKLLPEEPVEGQYYILNEDNILVTSGNYKYI